MSNYLDSNQVIRYLNTSLSTLARLRKRAGFPYTRLGGQTRYKLEEVDAWLASNRVKSPETVSNEPNQVVVNVDAGVPAGN